MPAELALLQETLARLTQSCVALLIRPRLLQHMLEVRCGDNNDGSGCWLVLMLVLCFFFVHEDFDIVALYLKPTMNETILNF